MIPAEEFLRALFGDDAPGSIALFTLPGTASYLFPASDLGAVSRKARDLAGSANVYFALAPRDRARIPEGKRGDASTALGIGALWAEIDARGGAHAAEAWKLPTLDEILEELRELPLAPSILVLSGGGIHAYWLLREFWTFGTDADRADADALARGWQGFLRRRWIERGKERQAEDGLPEEKRTGWTLDSTADLARILRLPGTLNRKPEYGTPRPVKVDLFEPELRYNPSDFEPYVARKAPSGPTEPRGDDGGRLPVPDALRLAGTLYARAEAAVKGGKKRHPATVELVGQLRDNRVPRGIAEALADPFVELGKAHGASPFRRDEFLSALEWAYSRPPRKPWSSVESSLEYPVETTPRNAPEEWGRALGEWRGSFEKTGISTGLPSVDDLLGGGWRGRRLYVLAGLTGSGKSALALRAADAAARAGIPVLVVQYEVEDLETRARLVAPITGTFYGKILSPDLLSAPERERVARAWNEYAEGPGSRIFVSVPSPSREKPRPGSIEWVKAEAARVARDFERPPLVIVDYLQPAATLSEDYAEDGNIRLAAGKVSLGLRELARSLECPVLALSSVPRAAYLSPRKGYQPPELGDLKESGDIEFNADAVLYLWPPRDDWEAHEGDDVERDPLAPRPLLFRVLKGRQSGGGSRLLEWNPPLGTFTDKGKPAHAEKPPRSPNGARKPLDADALGSLICGHGSPHAGTFEIEEKRALSIARDEYGTTERGFSALVAKHPDRFATSKRKDPVSGERVPWITYSPKTEAR